MAAAGAGAGGGWRGGGGGGAAPVPALPSPCCKPSSRCQAWAAPRGSLEAAGGALCQRDSRAPRDRALQTLYFCLKKTNTPLFSDYCSIACSSKRVFVHITQPPPVVTCYPDTDSKLTFATLHHLTQVSPSRALIECVCVCIRLVLCSFITCRFM